MIKKKIGILGGTFNPIHIGHLIIAEQVLSQLNLDEIYFMPDFIPPHVDKKMAIDAHDRVAMIKLAIKGNNHFKIALDEVNRKGKSYTFDTMNILTNKYPNVDFYFIIGGDMVAYLPTWYRIDELCKMVKFVGVNRIGSPIKTEYPVHWISSPYIDISSTFIRKSITKHNDIKYLVPNNVLAYIKEHQLYE